MWRPRRSPLLPPTPSKEPASQTVTSVVNELCGFPLTLTPAQDGFVINSTDGMTHSTGVTVRVPISQGVAVCAALAP